MDVSKPSSPGSVGIRDSAIEAMAMVTQGLVANSLLKFPETLFPRPFPKTRSRKPLSRSSLPSTRLQSDGYRSLLVAAVCLPVTFAFTTADALAKSRGYTTTPQELVAVAQKAAQGIQP